MCYLKKLRIDLGKGFGELYITDSGEQARRLQGEGAAVLVYLHPGSAGEDFSDFTFAVENVEELEPEYLERVYRRLKGLPWRILETERCLIRESTVEDVEDFYRIYSEPSITEYMDNLYPEREQERQYAREYIEKVYTYYEFGMWTVVQKADSVVIGRAGISYREGYAVPELGFVIGVPWQRRGYAEEVCRAILSYGREALGFTRFQTLVRPENLPSMSLCRKLGFREEERIELEGKNYCRMLLTDRTSYRKGL